MLLASSAVGTLILCFLRPLEDKLPGEEGEEGGGGERDRGAPTVDGRSLRQLLLTSVYIRIASSGEFLKQVPAVHPAVNPLFMQVHHAGRSQGAAHLRLPGLRRDRAGIPVREPSSLQLLCIPCTIPAVDPFSKIISWAAFPEHFVSKYVGICYVGWSMACYGAAGVVGRYNLDACCGSLK